MKNRLALFLDCEEFISENMPFTIDLTAKTPQKWLKT